MINAVNLQIARTHLLARKRQTIIAMLGVTFGIAMFILMISFMEGVNRFLEESMLQSTPDIHMYNDVKTDYSQSVASETFGPSTKVLLHHPKPKKEKLNIKDAYAIINQLEKNADVMAVSPHLSSQVFYNYGPVQINGILDGVNILQESRLYNIDSKMTHGKIENLLTTDNGLIMGEGLAKKLNVRTGDVVTLATPQGNSLRFRVVGLFQFGIGTIDNTKSYVNIGSVQQLLGKDKSYITDINIKLHDIDKAQLLAKEFQKKYGYKSEDWQTANATVMASFTIRNVLTYVVSITLLIVAGFGIYNIMNMTIASKMKDIAILKAEGFNSKDIVQIFLVQSLVIGWLGAISGMCLGFLLAYGLSWVPFPESDSISWKYFPVLFEPKHYGFGMAFGLVTTLIAGFMPSLKASKVDPVTILRG